MHGGFDVKTLCSAGFAVLMLAGCDAGPSAVMHDGDGKSPQAQKAKAPAWADQGAAASDDASVTPVFEPAPSDTPPESNTYAGSPYGAMPSNSPEMQQRDLAAAKAYPPLPVPSGAKAAITETSYGDWPLWSKNRHYTPDNNAHYQFDHHGEEIGARSYEDFLAVVHGFVHNPPQGTETLRRANGDVLLYDARDNVFAVMTKQGAPRTLFRPYEGVVYWQKQKQIEAAKAHGGGYGEDGGG